MSRHSDLAPSWLYMLQRGRTRVGGLIYCHLLFGSCSFAGSKYVAAKVIAALSALLTATMGGGAAGVWEKAACYYFAGPCCQYSEGTSTDDDCICEPCVQECISDQINEALGIIPIWDHLANSLLERSRTATASVKKAVFLSSDKELCSSMNCSMIFQSTFPVIVEEGQCLSHFGMDSVNQNDVLWQDLLSTK